ncbi:MAG: hypothetical protein Q4P78_00745 [Rothia sp. (in: high G+C Gram-positive bacteria)]|uniref:hypothetical protein n=1 Tax=Rothia sp. (in: high G+C Gram-positive bacteria) TaxID=1885016 RepID=UPI0026DFD72A|nr:hypothetical protein [Rothia sp. (in: high G+C Gram-positive bacteria)]MDO5749718.1 hypothetical protein [Rothia sp. (in: high G+C Gram-positive bacteria)]
MKRIIYFLSILLIVSISGCAKPDKTAPKEISIKSYDTIIIPTVQPDPLAINKLVDLFRTQEPLRKAEEKAITDCMHARGHTEFRAKRLETFSIRGHILVTSLSLEKARTRGYANPEDPEWDAYSAQTARMSNQALEDYTAGTPKSEYVTGYPGGPSMPEGTCLLEGLKALYGSAEDAVFFETIKHTMLNAYINSYLDSEEYSTMLKEWKTCMVDNSHPEHRSPDEAETKDHDNIDTAIADATCREKIDYEGRIKKGLIPYISQFIEDNPHIIAKYTEIKKRGEGNIEKVMNS